MTEDGKRYGDRIPDAADLLVAMGQFRRRVADATTEVRPFGAAHHALSVVTAAIDSLGVFMTGSREPFGSEPQARAAKDGH